MFNARTLQLATALAVALAASRVVAEPPQSPPLRTWTEILIDGETHQPLADVAVEVRRADNDPNEPRVLKLKSDEQGKVQIPLPPETATSLEVTQPGWWIYGWPIIGDLPEDFKDENGKPFVRDPSKPGNITFWRGTIVKGRLVRPDGTAASNVLLHAGVYITNFSRIEPDRKQEFNTWDHGEWPNWEKTTFTGDDGSFSMTVPPPSVRNWVRLGTMPGGFQSIDPDNLAKNKSTRALAEFAPFEIETSLRSTDEIRLHDLHLKAGVVLKGRVVDADGKPMPNIRLLTSGKRGPYAGRSATSAEDGTFAFLPMNAGKIWLYPQAPVREENGRDTRDVEAVFLGQEITIPESGRPIDLTIAAVPHVTLEFQWIDRRANKRAVNWYAELQVTGLLPVEGRDPRPWSGVTQKTTRDGVETRSVKVPKELTKAELHLPADEVLVTSYEDEQTVETALIAPLGDIARPRHRVIYGDDPKK